MSYLTIDGFEKLSLQEMFDMSLRHIRTTRAKSEDIRGVCTYSGTGCAAAPFIKPECREQADKKGGAWYVLRGMGKVPVHSWEFVRALQNCHDATPSGLDFMEHFECNMMFLAKRYGLIYIPEKES